MVAYASHTDETSCGLSWSISTAVLPRDLDGALWLLMFFVLHIFRMADRGFVVWIPTGVWISWCIRTTWKSTFVPVCLIAVWEPAGCHGIWGLALAFHSYLAPFLFMRKHGLSVAVPAFSLDCGIFCLGYFCVNPMGVAVPFTCSLSTSFQVH